MLVAVCVVPLLALPFILSSVASTTTEPNFVEVAQLDSLACLRADADTVVAQIPVTSADAGDLGVDSAEFINESGLELRAIGLIGQPLAPEQRLPPTSLVETLRPDERRLGLRAPSGEVHYLLLVISVESGVGAAEGVRLEYSPGAMRWADEINFELEASSSECTIKVSPG
ncbi:hypothetical protein LH407_12410 [Antiquaquibacter oligotrophicus]|uniref:hypothetical protein n=1 Tax=Antiquaquibacter oligotrophicus TaxID=2880260 RepID=UPI002AC9A713|nr:hypothetical protein [Antiquaquibacter oligotrophicus]UDF12948.1 hypothetical protein LH407_12410 [Antiquaquibacter oligotrophicus]